MCGGGWCGGVCQGEELRALPDIDKDNWYPGVYVCIVLIGYFHIIYIHIYIYIYIFFSFSFSL